MNWKEVGISELEAMKIVERGINNLVDSDDQAAQGYTPCGKCYLDTLMLHKGEWFIWYNNRENSSGIMRC